MTNPQLSSAYGCGEPSDSASKWSFDSYRKRYMAAISKADVSRFLEAKGATKPCEACGGVNFGIWDEIGQNSRSVIAAPKFPGWEIIGADAFEAVICGCENCGATRIHNRTIIVGWLQDNPA